MQCRLLIAFLFILVGASAQQPEFSNKAKIYLVRHGEKLAGNDPLLTPEGNKRAGDLYRVLKDKGIQRIYVTGYRRTRNTADSLRIQAGIDTVYYKADTSGSDLAERIMKRQDLDKTILVVGHSNTLPAIIERLGVANYPKDYIPDNEFDNLFLLTFKDGKPTLLKMKYGASSAASARMQ